MIMIIIIIIKMNLIEVALSHCCCRMSPCRVKQHKMILKTCKFSVPAEMLRSTKQPGLAAAGREFQARAAATGKARSPIVVRHVDGISRQTDSVERSCRPEERLDAEKMHSLGYCGAVPYSLQGGQKVSHYQTIKKSY